MKTIISKIWGWIRTDGLLHIACSALIMVLYASLVPMWCAAAITLAIGIGKEIYDKYTDGGVELHDVICDALGIVLGVAICLLWMLKITD